LPPRARLVRRFWEPRMLADAEPDPGRQDRRAGMGAGPRAVDAALHVEVERSGPAHLPHFVMQVELEGYEPERGEASSKRAAEQAAARAFLDRWASA
jgi:ribonuclease-3